MKNLLDGVIWPTNFDQQHTLDWIEVKHKVMNDSSFNSWWRWCIKLMEILLDKIDDDVVVVVDVEQEGRAGGFDVNKKGKGG